MSMSIQFFQTASYGLENPACTAPNQVKASVILIKDQLCQNRRNICCDVTHLVRKVCRDDVFLYRTGSLDKKPVGFLIGFIIIAENKICGKHKVMILTAFVQQDNLQVKTTFCH